MVLSCYHAVKRTAESPSRPSPAAMYINAVFVGDRSGSMASMGDVPAEGAADFLEKHKELADKNPNSEIWVTLVTFDNESLTAYSGLARDISPDVIARAKNAMRPRSTTRLIDTALEEIDKQQAKIMSARRRYHKIWARSPEHRDNVSARFSKEVRRLEPTIASSFTLLTDGDDNESHYTSRDLNEAIKNHQDEYETVCLFAAANQDAMNSGDEYGFRRERSLQIGNDVEEARWAFNSCNAAAVRSATQQSSDYTPIEREASCSLNFCDSDDDDGGGAPASRSCPVKRQ